MKKNVLKFLIATVLLSGGAVVAYAESGTTTDKPVVPPIRQVMKQNMEARKEVRASTTEAIKAIHAETKEEIKARLDARNKELSELKAQFASSTKERRDQRRESLRKVAENRINKMIDRIQATIDREMTIASKILTRATKMKENGRDTAQAEKFVADAKTHFAQAQTILDSVKSASSTLATLVDTGTTATSTKQGLEKVKGIVAEIEIHLKEGHKALEDGVKALGIANNPNATTTKSN